MAQALRTQEAPAFAPGRVLRVYGMRRSGNHALIDWIMRNAPGGNGVFLNNCRPNTDPVQSSRAITVFENGAEAALRGVPRPLCRRVV